MFKIDRKILAQELALLVQIGGQKNVIPALSTIRFEVGDGKASMLASNSNVALFTEIPCDGKWSGCIPARQLYDLMRLASSVEMVTFTPQESMMQISWGRARHRLPITAFEKFPDIRGPEPNDKVSVKTSDLVPAIERVLPCAARDSSSEYLTQGVKFEAKARQLKLIATNTHRLGVATIPCKGEINVFVPLEAAGLLSKLDSEEVTIWHDGKQASFSFGVRTLITRLMTGTFPNWEMIMPKYLPLNASLSTKEFTGALKRADVTRDETFVIGTGRVLLGVVFIFSKEELVIDTKHSIHGRSEESVTLESNLNGDLIYMGMNPDYVMDFLRFAGEKTTLELKDERNVLKLTDGSNFEYLIVPQSLRSKDATKPTN